MSLCPAVRVYECLLAYRDEHGYGGAEDYVFMPQLKNREHALAVLNFFFHWVLEKAGLEKGPLGQSRTLYCLRHTAITLRLLYGQGIDMLTLARNARARTGFLVDGPTDPPRPSRTVAASRATRSSVPTSSAG